MHRELVHRGRAGAGALASEGCGFTSWPPRVLREPVSGGERRASPGELALMPLPGGASWGPPELPGKRQPCLVFVKPRFS